VQGPDYLQNVAVSEANAANSAARAKQSELNALGSANKAHQHEINTGNSAEQARRYANSAEASAVLAAGYADDAKDSANDARNSANTASNQATNTATLVERAENAVAGIWAMQAPAWSSTKVYSYPDVVSYVDGNTYRCVGVNVPAGTHPDKSSNWVRLSVLGADDYFDVDIQGNLMPALNPTFAYDWQLDFNGNIMPWGEGDTRNGGSGGDSVNWIDITKTDIQALFA
jgi:hypothetical protein